MPRSTPLLAHLEKEPAMEPRGTFRWLHYHYLFRYPLVSKYVEIKLREQGLSDFAFGCDESIQTEPSQTLRIVERHAWSLGTLRQSAVAEKVWSQLSLQGRGMFLAGYSEQPHTEETRAWWRGHMEDAQLLPESACQLACNAIIYREPWILQKVMAYPVDWNAQIHRGEWDRRYPGSSWKRELKNLSHRLVDMILEAALQAGDLPAARLALEKGANPDLPFWRLERSYNERISALSYCLEKERADLTQLLLEHGASPRGTTYEGLDKPLFAALRQEPLALELISRGAVFRSKPTKLTIKQYQRLAVHWQSSEEKRKWAREALGPLIPLIEFEDKAIFHRGNGQGGHWQTYLGCLLTNDQVELVRLYESHGMDIRLSVEELLHAIEWKARKSLSYLFLKHGQETHDEALKRVREYQPDF
jgi:hypothetical protein